MTQVYKGIQMYNYHPINTKQARHFEYKTSAHIKYSRKVLKYSVLKTPGVTRCTLDLAAVGYQGQNDISKTI